MAFFHIVGTDAVAAQAALPNVSDIENLTVDFGYWQKASPDEAFIGLLGKLTQLRRRSHGKHTAEAAMVRYIASGGRDFEVRKLKDDAPLGWDGCFGGDRYVAAVETFKL